MNILVTGGSGSLGHALARRLLDDPVVERLCIVSRGELLQAEMAERFASESGPGGRLRFFLGDVRDVQRLAVAFHGIDTVIHSAALKRVDKIAYDSMEAVKTNVLGTANVIQAAVEAGVGRVLLVSSDKSVSPTTFYGSSKQIAEMLMVTANSHAHPRGTRLSVIRYGNVLASRGSVVNVWRDQQARGEVLTLTDPWTSRFVLTLPEAAGFVLQALHHMQGGEIFVPVLPACYIVDLLEAVTGTRWMSRTTPQHMIRVTGFRPGGEKRAETLIGPEETTRTVAVNDALWAVNPWLHSWRADDPWDGEPFPNGAVYDSQSVGWRLTVEELKKKLEEGRR